MNFKVCLFLVLIVSFGNLHAQKREIFYGDTLYMDKIINFSSVTYKDSLSFELKSNLPEGRYFVFDTVAKKKLISVGNYNLNNLKDSIWDFYGQNNLNEKNIIYYNGIEVCSITKDPKLFQSPYSNAKTRIFYYSSDSSRNYCELNSEGKIIAQWFFINGITTEFSYQNNGLLGHTGTSINGIKENCWIYYKESGAIDKLIIYKNDNVQYMLNF